MIKMIIITIIIIIIMIRMERHPASGGPCPGGSPGCCCQPRSHSAMLMNDFSTPTVFCAHCFVPAQATNAALSTQLGDATAAATRERHLLSSRLEASEREWQRRLMDMNKQVGVA